MRHGSLAFKEAGDADFIILGSTAGINDWDEKTIVSFVRENAGKLILTNDDWMLPFSMLGFVKIPQEQGEWAAKTAIAIHEGTPIQRIPIVANRKWEIYENTLMMKLAGIKNSEILRARYKEIRTGFVDDGKYKTCNTDSRLQGCCLLHLSCLVARSLCLLISRLKEKNFSSTQTWSTRESLQRLLTAEGVITALVTFDHDSQIDGNIADGVLQDLVNTYPYIYAIAKLDWVRLA